MLPSHGKSRGYWKSNESKLRHVFSEQRQYPRNANTLNLRNEIVDEGYDMIGKLRYVSLLLALLMVARFLNGQATSDPDPATFRDRLIAIQDGSQSAAQNAAAVMHGHSYRLSGTVVSATATSVQLTLVWDGSGDAVFHIRLNLRFNMKSPLNVVPAPGTNIQLSGTFDSIMDDRTVLFTDGLVPPKTTGRQGPRLIDQMRLAQLHKSEQQRQQEQQENATHRIFSYNSEWKVGDCHILSGDRLELTATPNGYTLHYVAQMKTDFTVFGDIFHITWRFLDATGNAILVSPEVDLPQNTSMRQQYGNYNVDYTTTIGPDSQPNIGKILQSIASIDMQGSC